MDVIYVFVYNEFRKLVLYPKGFGNEKGKNPSLFLVVPDSEKFSLKSKLNAKYKLRIRDQVNFKHIEQEGKNSTFIMMNLLVAIAFPFVEGLIFFFLFLFFLYMVIFSSYFPLKFIFAVNAVFFDTVRNWGCARLVSLSELYDESKGFIVDDTIVIEAEIEMLFVVRNFT